MALIPKHIINRKEADRKASEALEASRKRAMDLWGIRVKNERGEDDLLRDGMNCPILRFTYHGTPFTKAELEELGVSYKNVTKVTASWRAAE